MIRRKLFLFVPLGLAIVATLPAIANTLHVCAWQAPASSVRAAACTGAVSHFAVAPQDILSAVDGRARPARDGEAERFVQSGLAWEGRSAFAKARTDFDHAIALDPSVATAFVARGRLRASSNDAVGAIADFNEAIARGVDGADIYALRGLAHAATDEVQAALADFDAALARTPTLSAALCGRGAVLKSSGAPAQAQADFAKAARLARNEVADAVTESSALAFVGTAQAAGPAVPDAGRWCNWMAVIKGYAATALRTTDGGLRLVRRLSPARTA